MARVFRIRECSSLYQAGLQIGKYAADTISVFLEDEIIKFILDYTSTPDGKSLLRAQIASCMSLFPQMSEEVRGIAEGADVAESIIWALSFMSEILAHAKHKDMEHCSDVIVRNAEGCVVHGHTEDWNASWKELMYWVVYVPQDGTSFKPIGGLVYPGQAIGFAITFTSTLWTTQNSLHPKCFDSKGIPIVAAVRNALNEDQYDATVSKLRSARVSLGACIQVVGRGGDACSIETAPCMEGRKRLLGRDRYDMLTHFNHYVIGDDIVPHHCGPTTHSRANAVNALGRLSGELDTLRAISIPGMTYNSTTMVTVVTTQQENGFRVKVWTSGSAISCAPDLEFTSSEYLTP